ncbi:ubiquitin hydrolase [Rhynchospora pubera]|uniref:Ubiquitin hydrolase n=1 Tax=Rhynchospora pubera TaxID=906938 RepID=A0AAV8DFN4_9POAL|nr:ubiquitin hydrolase [Rhynchospora pubera]
MEKSRRPQIPSFGDWNYYNELPITQYFESAMQAGLVRSSHCSEEEEGENRGTFYLASPVKPTYRQSHPKVRKFSSLRGQEKRVAVKPVDEDLYKIPPELIKKPRRNFLRSLLTGCLGLNCMA